MNRVHAETAAKVHTLERVEEDEEHERRQWGERKRTHAVGGDT